MHAPDVADTTATAVPSAAPSSRPLAPASIEPGTNAQVRTA